MSVPIFRLRQLDFKRKTIKMNGGYCSDLEVDRRYVNGHPIRHVHFMSPYCELEASGLQVAESEKVASNDKGHRICGYRKTTFWLGLALVAFVTMGVIGISVAGFLATKWKAEAKEK